MRIELCPLGIEWVDALTGGVPLGQATVVSGPAKSGRTCVALGFAIQALERGNVCVVTSDAPEAVLEMAEQLLGRDFRPDVARRRLVVLSLAPFFDSKLRSIGSSAAPLVELGALVRERGAQFLIVDTIDPFLVWAGASETKRAVRDVLSGLRSIGGTALLTASRAGGNAALEQLEHEVSSVIWLDRDESGRTLTIRSAPWARALDRAVRLELVQRRGLRVVGAEAEEAARRAVERTDAFNVTHLRRVMHEMRAPSLPVIDSLPPLSHKPPPDEFDDVDPASRRQK